MLLHYKALETEDYINFLERIYPEKKRGSKKVKQITFQVTEDCCLKCTYCYQNNKTKNKLSFDMSKQLIDNLLNNKIDYINTDNTLGIVLDFIGGEPLMEIELISQIVEYAFNTMIEMDHPWLYHTRVSLCSNGILYNTPKVQEFFRKYNFITHLSISIDGNKELHDSCRIDLNGNGSYDRAIEAVHLYRDQYHADVPTKMTLSPYNINYLSEAIFNLIQENYKEIHLNCAFEPGWTFNHALIMYKELKKVADFLLDNNLYNKIFISLFREEYFQPMKETDNKNWCGGTTQGGHISLNHTGKLYPCIRYMDSSLNGKQEPIWIGDVKHGILITDKEKSNYEKINNITRRSQSTDECFYCPIAQGCAWCSAYNYEETGSVNKRLTYICCMHQATSLVNVYYWNKLYKKLNIDKTFKMHIPKQWALNIIDKEEYNYLLNLSRRDKDEFILQ